MVVSSFIDKTHIGEQHKIYHRSVISYGYEAYTQISNSESSGIAQLLKDDWQISHNSKC
jgi:hypothetical protein